MLKINLHPDISGLDVEEYEAQDYYKTGKRPIAVGVGYSVSIMSGNTKQERYTGTLTVKNITGGTETTLYTKSVSGVATLHDSGVLLDYREFNIPITQNNPTIEVALTTSTSTPNVRGDTQEVTLTLPTMLTPSTVAISPTSTTYGGTVSINLTRSGSAARHTVQYLNGTTWTTIGTAKTSATSVQWTVPIALANKLTSSPMKAQVRAITYDNRYENPSTGEKVEVGIKTATLTMNPSAELNPTSTLTLSDTETTVHNKFDGYVQNKSKIKAAITYSLKYSATLGASSLTMNGEKFTVTKTPQNFTSKALTTAGSNAVKLTILDSRGLTSTQTQNVTVYQQYNPVVSATAIRCDQSGTEDNTGAYIKITYSVDIAPINDRNDRSLTLYYKAAGDSSFTSVSIPMDAYKLTNQTYIFAADTEKTYQIYAEAVDYFATVKTAERTVPAAFVLMDFHHSGTGMSIGKVAELENRLDVGLTVILRNGIYSNLGWITLSNVGTPNAFETVYFRNDGVNNSGTFIRAYDIDEYGSAMVIRPGGPLLLGGGEYSTNRYGVDHPTGEDTYIGADGTVYIEPNGNSIANRKTWAFNTDGTLSSPNSKVELGTATTENIGIWGNSTNKIGVGVRNTQDNKRYNLLARDNYFGLENNTDSTWCWYISRDGTNRLRIQEDTHSFHVRDGMIGLYSQTDSAWTWQISGLSGTTNLAAIGAKLNKSATTSLANGTAKNITSQSFTAGTWLVTGTAEFPANATGRRAVQLSETSAGDSIATQSRSIVAPANGGPTVAQFTFVLDVTATKTYYLVGYQNSGSSLSTTGVIDAIRIK